MNLINIIKKDFVAYKKTWMFSLLYLLVFPLIIKNTNMNIMLITFVVYMVLGNAMAYDEKYKFDVFLGILPIKRKTVILSKMIELNLTYFVGSAILLIVGLLLSLNTNGSNIYKVMSFAEIAVGWVSVSMFCLFLFPIVYKFGYQKSRIVTIIIVAIAAALAGAAIGASTAILTLDEMQEKMLIIILSVSGIIIQLITYFLSKKIYLNKDF